MYLVSICLFILVLLTCNYLFICIFSLANTKYFLNNNFINEDMVLYARKPVFGVSGQAVPKQACSTIKEELEN